MAPLGPSPFTACVLATLGGFGGWKFSERIHPQDSFNFTTPTCDSVVVLVPAPPSSWLDDLPWGSQALTVTPTQTLPVSVSWLDDLRGALPGATPTPAEPEPTPTQWLPLSLLDGLPWGAQAIAMAVLADVLVMAFCCRFCCKRRKSAPKASAESNPFCPLYFAFENPVAYKKWFSIREHKTAQSNHGPVPVEGHVYDEKEGTPAALYVSTNGEQPHAVTEQRDQVEMVKNLSMKSSIKVGGWGSGMKDVDFFESIGDICPFGDKDFYGHYQRNTFSMKDAVMRADFLNALMRVLAPFVDGLLGNMANADEKVVLHWDGDELWDPYSETDTNYGIFVWVLAALLHARGRLEALLAVKNARTKWTKAIGSEPEGTAEDKWYRSDREGADGTPRQVFADRYFRDSKIGDMLAFIKEHGEHPPATPVPDMVFLVHSTEKSSIISKRQDRSGYGYFGASVQSAMAQGPGAQATVVMLGGGNVIYQELSNANWTGTAAADKATTGYQAGTTVVAFDVKRKALSQRCQIFEDEGEPETLFAQNGEPPKLKGKILRR